MEQINCQKCNKPLLKFNSPDDTYGHYIEITRGTFTLTSDDETDCNVKAQLHLCEDCYLTDPDLCRFFNKIGWQIR